MNFMDFIFELQQELEKETSAAKALRRVVRRFDKEFKRQASSQHVEQPKRGLRGVFKDKDGDKDEIPF